MNRLLFIGLTSLLALTTAVGCSNASEEETETSESADTSINSDYTHGGSEGTDAWGRPIEQPHPNGGSSGCQTCGPVPDPWKSVSGPVPDPWDGKPHSSGTGSAGSNNGNGKP